MPKKAKKTSASPAKKTASKTKAAKPVRKPAARKAPLRKSAAPRRRAVVAVTAEDIALKAYYLGERRRHLGLPGSPESDWLQAERELRG
jgi:hypothetical protein